MKLNAEMVFGNSNKIDAPTATFVSLTVQDSIVTFVPSASVAVVPEPKVAVPGTKHGGASAHCA